MKSDAKLSEDRRFRYWLTRVWDDTLPMMCVIGLNPSTADEHADDPTIRKCIGFARRLGFGGLLMLNVGAYRSTSPKTWRNAIDPFGPENSVAHLWSYIIEFNATQIIAAWGKNGNYVTGRCAQIAQLPNLYCFGRNPDGTPRHPLMLPYSTKLEAL
jgi:hypothetical protein